MLSLKLIELTTDLRSEYEEKDKDVLMIHRVSKGKSTGKVMSLNTSIIRNWLHDFIKRNNIMDANA